VLGVSIVLYRSEERGFLTTLRAVAAQTEPPTTVAVHANSMSDVDADRLRPLVVEALGAIPVELTASTDNLGFAGGHNRLLAALIAAGCDAVVVLNPDLALDPAAIAALSAAAGTLPTPLLLGPVLELADPQTLEPTGRIDTVGIRWTAGGRHLDDRQGEPMTRLPPDPVEVAGISGACLYVPLAAYERVLAASGEFFDEDFIAYREDAELAFRAKLVGVASYLVPAARGGHARGLRGTSRGANAAIDSLGVRNRFLIAFKYGLRRPGRLVPSLLRDVVVIAAVLGRERSSLPGLRDAWRLRGTMRAKGRQVRAFTARQQ
jgi:GT2 family glycosyltransferase